MQSILRLVWVILIASFPTIVFSQLEYTRQEWMIPMRDGVKLYTVIYTPTNHTEPLPFLLTRTPYGVADHPGPDKVPYTSDLAQEGYFFVYQDIRGRYKSEGTFEMQRFSRDQTKAGSIDESTDAWDTIDWLLKNIKSNNGKAGMYGISYDGWTTIIAALDPHPALVAVSEQATPADMWLGDDFHHNGAFRLSYGFEYAFMEEAAKTDSLFPFKTHDLYEWYLRLGPLSNVNQNYFHQHIPTWNDFVVHPDYDSFWVRQSLAARLSEPKVFIQHVGGWWDQEDLYGPQTAYRLLEKNDRTQKNFFVAGPWNHGGWASGKGDHLGNIPFGTPTGEYFRKEIQARWFNYHLKGKGNGTFAESITFQTGSNQWKTYDHWPPSQTKNKPLYLSAKGKLSFDKPLSVPAAADSFLSDPAKPVPYRTRPVEATYGPGSRWYTWLTEDQRFVHNRPDVLSWETEPLQNDLTVTGNILAKLFVSTTGSDADWIVKLIDVYPAEMPESIALGGYQLMVASEVFRGRYRNSYAQPQAFIPGKRDSLSIDLHQINHVFKKGHKVMVHVQSSWFPIIDRNPQRFVPNIFKAGEADFIKATHKVFRTPDAASCIELSIADQ